MNFNDRENAVELKHLNVLILDDEPLVRLMIRSKLEKAGAQVNEAGCCADALALIRNTAFDAALFDYRLPDGNGLDVVRRLRKEAFSFPVAMLSGEAADLEAENMDGLGICAVFSKPPDVALIAETLTREAAGCALVEETARVGRYAYFKAEPGNPEVPPAWDENEWLAIDFSAWADDGLPDSMIDGLCRPRRGVAVVGAKPILRKCFERLEADIEFAADIDELAALSRRPTSPLERAVLLDVCSRSGNGI
ncbi:response regulator [Verrucomicrobia bacterium S94]|nr:response regulator [Verrucomicrobia bacterium S94]